LFDSNTVKSICDNGVGRVSSSKVDCTTIKSVSTPSANAAQASQTSIPVTGGGVTVSTSSVQQPPVITISPPSNPTGNSLSLNTQGTPPNTYTLTITQTSTATPSCNYANLINFIFNSSTPQTQNTANGVTMTQTDVNTLNCTTPPAK
jgi:hypothetical protein